VPSGRAPESRICSGFCVVPDRRGEVSAISRRVRRALVSRIRRFSQRGTQPQICADSRRGAPSRRFTPILAEGHPAADLRRFSQRGTQPQIYADSRRGAPSRRFAPILPTCKAAQSAMQAVIGAAFGASGTTRRSRSRSAEIVFCRDRIGGNPRIRTLCENLRIGTLSRESAAQKVGQTPGWVNDGPGATVRRLRGGRGRVS
jgi:hypothetical protein